MAKQKSKCRGPEKLPTGIAGFDNMTSGGLLNRSVYVKKYRGSAHVQNQVPYIISSRGLEVEPTMTESGHFKVYRERLPTGIPDLDDMLRGGIYRGSTTLLTGSPGTAKTTIAGRIAEATCRKRHKVLYLCFDESAQEIVRNLASVNIDLDKPVGSGRLHMEGFVTRSGGVDLVASRVRDMLQSFKPRLLVLDPVSALSLTGSERAQRRRAAPGTSLHGGGGGADGRHALAA